MTGLSAIAGVLLLAPVHDVDVTSVARVFLDQVGERRYHLSVVDLQAPPLDDPVTILPIGCARIPQEEAGLTVRNGFAFECDEPLNDDDTLRLPWSLEGTVVLARWSDGEDASAYFAGDGRSIDVPLARLRAGASTLTAFTLAHSITLGAAVLGFVPIRSGPVEAAIALSIVLLAREVVAAGRGEEHLVHRQPWLVAFAFGLLHGLGFAGALGELGLRGADIPPALLFFNVGVEAGQLAFVGVLLGACAVARRASTSVADGIPRRMGPALGYALGGLSMFWFVQRLPAVFGA